MARKTKTKPRTGVARLIARAMKMHDERPEKLAARLRLVGIRISSSSIYNFLNGREPSENMARLLREELEKMFRKRR